MGFIQRYFEDRKLKKFKQQEELRVKKEKIKLENDLRIKKEKDLAMKKSKQMDCTHNYVVLSSFRRAINYAFQLKEHYYTYNLICTKCHNEKRFIGEEQKDYLLNKSKIINGKTV